MTAVTDVQYRTSRPRMSASGWLYLPCAVVRQKYRAGRAVDELAITVDGPTEDLACEVANELIFELTRDGCTELDREDRTFPRPGHRPSFTLTVAPAGRAIELLLEHGYYVSRGEDSGADD